MINIVKPEDRFNKIISEYRKDRINPDSKPVCPWDYDLPFEYCCPKCGYNVLIKNQDFEKHSKSKHSNLKIADRDKIENCLISNQIDKFFFLDFECPKCSMPVRVLFLAYPGGLGEMVYKIEHVIEINSLVR